MRKNEEEDDDDEEVEVVAERAVVKGRSKAKSGTPKARSQQTTPPHRFQRVRRVVEVVTAWKVLLPGVGDRASAMKMADEVLKLLTVIGLSGTSGTMKFAATQSQPTTSKRKATAAKWDLSRLRAIRVGIKTSLLCNSSLLNCE
ncbi:hypothetical protein Scep_014815 [Stephania cephalantha]|uniref:Uncharacterized protein n=1 Tax=Stephania cephalantha TaxID=152367 RepID=A0AAP0J1Z3_9MAGN